MIIKYFNLFDGSLEFHDDKIIIFDKAEKRRISRFLSIITCLIYSITTLIRGYQRHDNINLWFGLILTVIWCLVIILERKEFQRQEREILLSNINQVKFSIDRLDGSVIAKILKTNGSQRKIKLTQEYNQDFDFKNLLLEHKIRID